MQCGKGLAHDPARRPLEPCARLRLGYPDQHCTLVRDPFSGGVVEMSKLRLLDLFSGIGGFSLGLERSGGFETVAFCEIEDFPRRVLAKHWPEVPCYHDIRELNAARLAADGIAVDAICGGFPCQDISNAGKCAGIEGERSGLWSEYARLIGELRPRVVFVENVSALLGRGLDRVLGDLAALGYDAWWDCIPASAVGAPHQRDRLWIVAYAKGERGRAGLRQGRPLRDGHQPRNGRADVSDAFRKRLEGQQQTGPATGPANGPGNGCDPGWWATEPNVGRVAHGVSARSHRLKALGNAVVPQIPELLGRAWMEAAHG